MAARRCIICSCNFPAKGDFKECPLCGETTKSRADLSPHDDWKKRIEDAAKDTPFEDGINKHRAERFEKAGLDPGRAQWFAWRADVDLHEFEGLIERGCEVETAARIVAPL
jgi:hypothetical protein